MEIQGENEIKTNEKINCLQKKLKQHKKLHKSSDHKSLKVGIYLEERQVLNMNILFLFDSDMRGDGKYPYC